MTPVFSDAKLTLTVPFAEGVINHSMSAMLPFNTVVLALTVQAL